MSVEVSCMTRLLTNCPWKIHFIAENLKLPIFIDTTETVARRHTHTHTYYAMCDGHSYSYTHTYSFTDLYAHQLCVWGDVYSSGDSYSTSIQRSVQSGGTRLHNPPSHSTTKGTDDGTEKSTVHHIPLLTNVSLATLYDVTWLLADTTLHTYSAGHAEWTVLKTSITVVFSSMIFRCMIQVETSFWLAHSRTQSWIWPSTRYVDREVVKKRLVDKVGTILQIKVSL